jgi:hypothetical protein
MEIKDILIGVLTKTLNQTPDELEELIFNKPQDGAEATIKDDAVDLIISFDSTRVENIKKNVTPDPKLLEGQYSRGKKEALTTFEKELKEQYALDGELQGTELVNAIVDKVKVKPKLTEDEVKTHPLYRSLENDRVAKEEHEKVLSEFAEYKTGHERKEKLFIVKRDVSSVLRTLNPVISTKAEVAATREADFLNKFDAYDFELQDDGNHFVMQNGKRQENAQGHPVLFKDFVQNIASLNYDFKAQDDKGGAGNESKPGSNGENVFTPKSEQDYFDQRAKLTTPEDRSKLDAVWKEVTLQN